MRRGRLIWLGISLLVVVLLVGWGIYSLLDAGGGGPTATARTVAAGRANVIETVTAAGVLQSVYSANVDFGTAGTVAEIAVSVGDTVTKGQRLAKLDDTLANKQVQVARANLDAARQNLFEALNRGTPAAQLRAQVQQAELQLAQARDTLAAMELTAPGDGTVVSLAGGVGRRAGDAGTPFLLLSDLANLTVRASVTDIDVSKLRPDQQASVTVNALPNQPVQARVTDIDRTPTTSNAVVQYGVALAMANPPQGLRPGQSATVQVTVAEATDTLAVPVAALRTVGGQSTITVWAGGQQVRRPVSTGVRSEALVQITSGLREGDQVVLPSPGGEG